MANRDLTEISRRGGGKQERVTAFLSPSKGKVMEKKGKEKRQGHKKSSQHNKDALILFNIIISECSECVFLSGRRSYYHPIKPKAFF